MTVVVRKGNLSPSLFDTIRQGGVPFDLTGSSVKLQARFDTATTLEIDAAATIISAATTLSANVTLPEPSITVASTSGFLASGALNVGSQIVEYDEISGNTFLGCRGGDGTVSAATAVSQRGGVRYDWVAGDVDTAGDLIAWWRVTLPSAKVQETPEFDLVIEDPLVVFRGLCELEDVISYAPGYRRNPDPDTDNVLRRMILSETRAIRRETGQEVISIFPAVGTRRFDLARWNVRERKVFIGALAASPSTVKLIDSDQVTEVQTVTSSDYVLMPRVREASDPITHLYFPPLSPAAVELTEGRVVEVAGTWGFPSVPDDLREACAKIVIFRYASDAALAGTLLSESLAEVNIGALFASGRQVVENYILGRVA